ncbi:DNA replication protein psf2 [Cladophialophora chaetospira]|uniref:DNA replication complex GINS protein PSF2 n=1 Tax=Cladophialophora chaetospira TaxID=386627 RepID=A0AA38X512_9EURO|nr:DNA replication protein psf2 [Cladophialophora chaetospira]
MAAFPHPMGLLPSEVAFLCGMEQVTIIPRQRLERLDLLGGPTRPLIPPQRTTLPLWLAVLLKRQRRANILPPPFLLPENLADILDTETNHDFTESFSPPPTIPAIRQTDFSGKVFYASPPFVESCTADAVSNALPYHWFEVSEILLEAASDDIPEADRVRQLLRDIREVRLAKMRKQVENLAGDGEGTRLDGVGAMEISESRGFMAGVVDGLRKLDASREQERREREEDERENRRYNDDDDDDEDMT